MTGFICKAPFRSVEKLKLYKVACVLLMCAVMVLNNLGPDPTEALF